MTATDVPYFRYPIPQSICRCSHAIELHRIDTKAQACDLGGCSCRAFDLAVLRWTEKRTIDEPVGGS